MISFLPEAESCAISKGAIVLGCIIEDDKLERKLLGAENAAQMPIYVSRGMKAHLSKMAPSGLHCGCGTWQS